MVRGWQEEVDEQTKKEMDEIPQISRKDLKEIADWAESLRGSEGCTFWLHKIRGGLTVTLAPQENKEWKELEEAMDTRVLEMWPDS